MGFSDFLYDYHLLVTATSLDQQLERRYPTGGSLLRLGRTGLPAPLGREVAAIDWTHSDRGYVVANGRRQALAPNQHVVVSADDGGELDLLVVRRFWLRPFEPISLQMSLAWFTVVLTFTVATQQADFVAKHFCEWASTVTRVLPGWEPYMLAICPTPKGQQGAQSQPITAEYLARLLKHDYSGEDRGYQPLKVQPVPIKDVSLYLPAGSDGPITTMGGASDVAPEPVRTPKAKANAGGNQDALQQAKDKGHQDVVSTGPKKAVAKAGQDDKVAEAKGAGEHQGDGSDDNAKDDQAPPAEKHEGWGVQDWYDAADQDEEKKQIEQELKAAKQRLRIDPNDRDALSVLAYYQYLSEDFDGALGTYQKFIKNFPDDPAGYNNLALVYKRQKRYSDEEPLYHLALALAPDDTTALDNLAVNLAHQGRYPEALRIMQRLAVLDPGDPYADLHRAKIHAAMGDDEQAYYFLDKACAGMKALDTLHMIEFRQDIRVDPAFDKIRETRRFHDILTRYYGKDSPLQE